MKFPKMIGHRGACGYAPENTLASLRKAKELGAACVEFDVQLTADDEPIIFHDDTLDRTTDGFGLVEQKTLSELLHLDAGSWFSPAYALEQIPTLSMWLETALALDLSLNLEIKPSRGREHETVRIILNVLHSMWPSDVAPPLLSSFDSKSLLLLNQFDSPYPVGMLMHEWRRDWLTMAKQLKNCVSIHVNQAELTEKRATEIKKAGYGLLSYTVNDKERADRLFSWGVDGVFTDFPDVVSGG